MLTTQNALEFLPALVQERIHSSGAQTFPVFNPANGALLAQVADHSEDDAKVAADHTVKAFARYRQTTAYERGAIMRRWYTLMMEQEAQLGRLMALEMGKPITEARGEVRYAAGFIDWYAEEAKRVYGDTIPASVPHKRLFATRQPVGPVYAITPWNFPAAMVTRKAAPALAAGCTFILKPAEQTPLTAIYMQWLWEQAGGVPDVFQVLTTANPIPITRVFMDDQRIRKLTFTGSTEVGRILYGQASATLKRMSLELGGHAPFLVFADADLDLAVKEVVACKFRNAGQTCVCTNRIYVQESIAQPFTEKLAAAVAALRVGDPLNDQTQIGPLIDDQGLDKVRQHVSDAVAHGAQVVTGGSPRDGLYFAPTVILGCTPDMLIMNEETFGPVAPVITFADDAEAIRAANDTPFGLAAYLYTRDIDRAIRVAEALDYGIIGLNDGVPSVPQAPFGGIKQSGLGREGGKWGIEEYLDVKYISLALH
jgi:succinate-semialdehyde dehydrogenase / glutarate-semialdehyde dehydrogenase